MFLYVSIFKYLRINQMRISLGSAHSSKYFTDYTSNQFPDKNYHCRVCLGQFLSSLNAYAFRFFNVFSRVCRHNPESAFRSRDSFNLVSNNRYYFILNTSATPPQNRSTHWQLNSPGVVCVFDLD